jgi:hypothetical protein
LKRMEVFTTECRGVLIVNLIHIQMITVERITITEDYALMLNTSIDFLIQEKEQEGFREINRYNHPAVGLVVVLTNAPIPDYCLV